ncbi:glycosyltransferase [Rhizohabitans arisaemae]|uniref:glycosyltransferase n=1 Tax=Rhizohabitans arisaemae TaxID=2720610 RepID=UPI0024B139F0|nr:nucleotide disphospho-sugar-binding domain-containing protein [Rhizohabitans arisaemae]
MSRLLLVPYGEPGHTEPMSALGLRLRAHGHRVAVFAEPEAASRIAPELRVLTPARWRSREPIPPGTLATGDGAALFRHRFFGSVTHMTHDVLEAAERVDAEVVVGDVFAPGAGLAAELAGLPWASLACTPVPALDSHLAFIPPHTARHFDAAPARDELGLPPDGTNLLGRISPYLHLIPTTPGFAGAHTLPGHVRLTGPLTPGPAAPPAPDAGGRPTIAVTTSTASRASLGGRAGAQDRYLRAVVAAVGRLDVDAVLTLPAATDPAVLGPLPANLRPSGPVPHEELFGRCAAVVSHAGWGTVGRALIRGLPLVLVPITGDQGYIARRCAELGLGIALDPSTIHPQRLGEAIEAVCGDPDYRKAAREFAAELATTAPLDAAASFIASLPAGKG